MQHANKFFLFILLLLIFSFPSPAQATQMLCAKAGSASPRYLSLAGTKPRKCAIATYDRPLAHSRWFTDMRWSFWGANSARGTATLQPNHSGQGEKPIRATLRAYLRVRGCTGKYVFALLRMTTRYGSFTHVLDESCDRRVYVDSFREDARPSGSDVAISDVQCGIGATSKNEQWQCSATRTDLEAGCDENVWGSYPLNGRFRITEVSDCE